MFASGACVLVLPVDDAEPGVCLALPVLHPQQPGQELLKAGYVLDEPVLRRLRQLGVETLYVAYPELADLDRHLLPVLSPARQRIYTQIRNTIRAVEKTAKPTVTFPDYYAATRELVITLLNQGQHAVYMEQLAGRAPEDEIAHATAVAHVSLMLGIRLEQYLIRERSRLSAAHAREVVNLGVAGMLHDIGKPRLPESVRGANALLIPEDPQLRAEWEAHPRVGYEMVRGGIESSAAVAILQHHQRFDGTGFPSAKQPDKPDAPLAGAQIHVFARIIAAADLYDRLAAAPDGRRRTNLQVLHRIRSEYASWIDPQILRILPSVVPPFPPGTIATLDDQRTAVIVGNDPANPYAPTVRQLERGLVLTGEPFVVNTPGQPVIAVAEGESTDEMLPTL